MRTAAIALVPLLLLVAPVHSQEDDADALVRRFEKRFSARSAKKRGEAHDLLDRVRDSVVEDASHGADLARTRARHLTRHVFDEPLVGSKVKPEFREAAKPSRGAAAGVLDPFPFPIDLTYRFGTRDLQAANEGLERRIETVRQKRQVVDPHFPDPATRLRALLVGASPALELEWIALTAALDVDPRGDRFAQFLHAWKNVGPGNAEETFYEALDRTAGTQEAVFFYDVMLTGYTKAFGVEAGKRSVDAAHDHLGRAFLQYRSYRSFVEAVAWCLVLPPDVPLPQRLDRYDYGAKGAMADDGFYLLRHRIHMLVASQGGDPWAVVAFVRRVLEGHPLPEELGAAAEYAPLAAFESAFLASVGSNVAPLLRDAVAAERALAARRREAVRAALHAVDVH